MKNIFKLYNIFLFLLIIFFIGLSYIFQDEKSTLNKDTQDRINTQSNYINEYFTINKAFILSLKNTLTSNFYIEDLVHPAFNEIQNKPALGTYNILCNLNNVQSTLNGDKTLSNITLDTVQELNSALYLHPLFRTILNSNHDIKWVYYTSAKNFIYLAPSNDIWDDKFLKYQFTKEFWTEAIPENNPSGELVLTKVYDDGMGKGYITTLSLPIFKDDVFMGVLSIDIGIEKLNKMISDIKVQGKLYLINEDDLIIASNQKFKLNEEIEESKETFSINIFENRLKLIYIEDKSERILTIIYSALPMIMLLFFILVIVYILIYQIVLIKKIKKLADKDSLTFLLNRRAMTKECTRQLSIAKRYEQDTSLLLLDIDFFKRVNDTY
jgi:GGDEF domain-containing protein